MKKPVTGMLFALILFTIAVSGMFIYRINSENDRIDAQSRKGDSAFYSGKLDINCATESQFEALPGIGETIAQRIISYRNENGRFTSIEQLQNIKGMTADKLKSIKEYIAVIDP